MSDTLKVFSGEVLFAQYERTFVKHEKHMWCRFFRLFLWTSKEIDCINTSKKVTTYLWKSKEMKDFNTCKEIDCINTSKKVTTYLWRSKEMKGLIQAKQ